MDNFLQDDDAWQGSTHQNRRVPAPKKSKNIVQIRTDWCAHQAVRGSLMPGITMQIVIIEVNHRILLFFITYKKYE